MTAPIGFTRDTKQTQARRYSTIAVSPSSNPAGATTIPAGASSVASSGRTCSPAASQSTVPAAVSQMCTPRS